MAPRSGLKKRRRALRARARQRPRAATHDIRGRYRQSDLPAQGHIGVVTIEDPYAEAGRIDPEGNLDVSARLSAKKTGAKVKA